MSKSEKVSDTAPFVPPSDTADMWSASEVTPEVSEKLAGKLVIATVPVKKPRGGQWVFVHPWSKEAKSPDDMWCRTVWVNEDTSSMEKECWLLDMKLIPSLTSEIPKERLLVAYAVKDGGVCLWPLSLPSGKANSYVETALLAASNYAGKWIKLVSNTGTSSWDVYERQIETAAPRWPEGGFRSLFETAFKNRFIRDLEHPVIRERMGKA